MFNHAFYNKIEKLLSSLHGTAPVSLAQLGRCMSDLEQCLFEAEVEPQCIRQFTDGVLDGYAGHAAGDGRHLADLIGRLIETLPGMNRNTVGGPSWADRVPARRPAQNTADPRWDMKELDNCLPGFNRASLGRLRSALGHSGERRLPGTVDLRRRRRFQACGGMQVTDRHDGRIDGEQINRLIRYLGWDEPGTDPHGGRPARLA